MAKRKERTEKLFGTKQVAELLQIPDWRVKNFSEGGAYRLPPSQTIGSGRGSRRLYSQADIARVAIANQLVNFGFSPEAVGDALGEVTNSLLVNTLHMPAEPHSVPILICDAGKWRVRDSMDDDPGREVKEADHGIFFLDLYNALAELADKLRE